MPQTRPTRSSRQDEEVRIGWKMAGIGFQVASEAAAGALLGYLYDRWQGTAPTGLLVGSIVGIAVAMWSLISRTLKLNRQLDALTAGRRKTSGPARPLAPDNDPWKDDGEHDGEGHDDLWNADDSPGHDHDADDDHSDDEHGRRRQNDSDA